MRVRLALATVLVAALAAHAGPLDAATEKQLGDAPYVYLQSQRKTGAWSKPAEIWFLWHQGAVWVGTRPDSWRVKRIKWRRPAARIAVGKTGGPTFEATGAVVKDPAVEAKLLETFAVKYPSGWGRWETSFREGFKSGDRVLVRYTPK